MTPREAFQALAIACLAVAAWLAIMLAYVLSEVDADAPERIRSIWDGPELH